MIAKARRAAVPLFLFLCLLLGGSSRGIIGPFILQLLAIALLAWSALAREPMRISPVARPPVLLAGAAMALVLVQLVPLPPAVWSALPGRQEVAAGYALLGQPLPWLPISLAPHDTVAALLFFLPPLAVLAGMLVLGAYRRRWIVAAIIAATVLSIALGALQVASGGDPATSRWYLYRITNQGVAVGFFANANHLATLLLVSIPFLAAFVARRLGRSSKRTGAAVALALPSVVVILLGLYLNKSLAGLLLLLPVAVASGLLLFSGRGKGLVVAVTAIAGLIVTAVLLSPAVRSRDSSSVQDRGEFYANTVAAIGDTIPFGTGFGSFERVYHAYEDPAAVDRTYVNHAHSDYLELALEGGLPAILLMLVFLLWWVWRTAAIWRSGADFYAQAATIASGAMLAHSIVDYPLRTEGLAALFALCLALMVEPRRRPAEVKEHPLRPARHIGVS